MRNSSIITINLITRFSTCAVQNDSGHLWLAAYPSRVAVTRALIGPVVMGGRSDR